MKQKPDSSFCVVLASYLQRASSCYEMLPSIKAFHDLMSLINAGDGFLPLKINNLNWKHKSKMQITVHRIKAMMNVYTLKKR